MRTFTVIALFVVIVVGSVGAWLTASRLTKIEALEQQTAALNQQLGRLRGELQAVIVSTGGTVPAVADEKLPGSDGSEIHTAADVNAEVAKLGTALNPRQMSACLLKLDGWVIRPDEDAKATAAKTELVARLRAAVAADVLVYQQKALNAPTGGDAVKAHAEAGQLLALYPMSEDDKVITEAKHLASRQGEVANRIEIIRRQRYNHWASQQIEAGINGYNKGSSYWSPKKENKVLMDSLVNSLAQVDPGLIEPAVMELYSYVIDLTKGSISESEKIELAKRLTDPSVRRKTLGDF